MKPPIYPIEEPTEETQPYIEALRLPPLPLLPCDDETMTNLAHNALRLPADFEALMRCPAHVRRVLELVSSMDDLLSAERHRVVELRKQLEVAHGIGRKFETSLLVSRQGHVQTVMTMAAELQHERQLHQETLERLTAEMRESVRLAELHGALSQENRTLCDRWAAGSEPLIDLSRVPDRDVVDMDGLDEPVVARVKTLPEVEVVTMSGLVCG